MLVNLLQNDFDIQLKEYSSESEMLSDLSLCKKGYTILENSEYDYRFISVKISLPIEHLELYNDTLIAISQLDYIQMNLKGEILSEGPFDSCLESFEIIDNKIICQTEKGKSEHTIL